MRSRLVLAGTALAAVLTAAAVIGAVLEWWWLVVAAGMALLSATLLAALDVDRRTRSLRRTLREELARGGAGPVALTQAPPVTEADITGAVRVLQAQYTGRMDRMQTSLEEALAGLRDHGRSETPDSQQSSRAAAEGDRA